VLLEDFSLRGQPAPEATVAPEPVAEVLAPEGVVWTGRAQRRPELQRFVDHLSGQRTKAAR
jgi:hypothetical protein